MGSGRRYVYGCKIKGYALLAILCLAQLACAQNTDSLLAALNAHPAKDTNRVNILIDLAETYKDDNLDSMVLFANEGLSIATQLNDGKGMAACMAKLGLAYLRKSDYVKSLNYYTGALHSYEKRGRLHSEANTLISIGDVYYSQSKRAEAIEYYNKGIEIFDKVNYPTGKGFAYMSMGSLYDDIGNYMAAANNYLKALAALQQDNYAPGIAMSLSYIANIYSEMGDNKKAIEYLEKCIAADESKSSRGQKLIVATNVGGVYGKMKDYHKALFFLNKGALLADSIGDMSEKNSLVAVMADMYFGLQSYDTAFTEYTEALEMGEKLRDTGTIIEAGNGLGHILVKNGNVKEGIKRFLASFELARENQLKRLIYETALALSDAYEKENDYANALRYHKVYYDYYDTLHNEKIDKRVAQLQFDYDLAQKQHEIQLLEKNRLIEQSKIETQNLMLSALVCGLALLATIAFILYRSRLQIKRSKDNILKQKEEIQLQATKLEELNRFKDKTFSVLSHDLRGPINNVWATLAMLDQKLISPEEFAMLKPEVMGQLADMGVLVENLLNWAKGYIQGQTTGIPEITDLYKIAGQNIRLMQRIADKKQITLRNCIDDPTPAFCDPGQIDIVVRNLLTNAIKFTVHGGTIVLSAVTGTDTVKLTIADTGVGMTEGQLKKLFIPIAGNHTYGTDGETGTGLGLLLCHEFIKANNGTISVTSEVGKGSAFTITLPRNPR